MQINIGLFSLTDLQNIHTNEVWFKWSKQSFNQVKANKTLIE